MSNRRFTIDTDKLNEISETIGWTESEVSEVLLESDWAEGDEHQSWIQRADVAEIVSWLESVGA